MFDSKGYSETKSFDHSLLKAVRKSIKNQVMVAGGIKIDDNFSKIASFTDFCDLSGNLESKKGIKDLSEEIWHQQSKKIVIIISTVLPGTIRREIIPLLGKHTKLCYNPFFIAMGTTMRDFLHPEFILFGYDSSWAEKRAEKFYKTITHAPIFKTSCMKRTPKYLFGMLVRHIILILRN